MNIFYHYIFRIWVCILGSGLCGFTSRVNSETMPPSPS